MPRYAMVRSGIVITVFDYPGPAADFPDIGPMLFVAANNVAAGWSYDGNNFAVPPAAPVPPVVALSDLRLALLAANRLDAVEAAAALLAPDMVVRWKYRQTIARNSPLVAAIATAGGFTSAQVDALFRSAAQQVG